MIIYLKCVQGRGKLRSFLCINIAMEKNKQKPKLKEHFIVKLEGIVPVTLTYRILAESPEEATAIAIKLQGQQQASPPKIMFSRFTKFQAKVYRQGRSILEFVKNF